MLHGSAGGGGSSRAPWRRHCGGPRSTAPTNNLKLPRFGGRVDCVVERPSVWAVGAVEIAERFPRTLWAARPFAPSTGPAASIAPQNCSLIMLPVLSGPPRLLARRG